MSMFSIHAVKHTALPTEKSVLNTGRFLARKVISYIVLLRRRKETYERLCDLDDRTLRDIGLCRSGLMFFKHHEAFHEMNEISNQPDHREGDE